MPTLSVCIPAYNGERFLAQSLQSVFTQTLQDFELIVVDDHSTDTTRSIVESHQDHRMQYFLNESHLGLVGNWNRCIDLANGDYITILHQDDLLLQESLEQRAAFLKKNPSIGFVYTNALEIDEQGNPHDSRGWEPGSDDAITVGAEFFNELIAAHNFIRCSSVMTRRACYDQLGQFDTRLPFTADLEMWLRIASHYDVGYLSNPYVKYRWHADCETQRFMNNARGLHQIVYAKKIALQKNPRKLPKQVRDRIAQYHWKNIARIFHYCRVHRQYGEMLKCITMLCRLPGISVRAIALRGAMLCWHLCGCWQKEKKAAKPLSGTPMRPILFITPEVSRTGAPLVLLSFLRWLKAQTDIPFHVLTLERGQLEDEFSAIAPTWFLPLSRKRRRGRMPQLLNTAGRQDTEFPHDFSLAYCNSVGSLPALSFLPMLDCPTIAHVHELWYYIENAHWSFDEMKTHVKYTIAASEHARQDIIQHFHVDPASVETLHSFVEYPFPPFNVREVRERICGEVGVPHNSKLVVGVGVPEWRKGLDLFVEVAHALQQFPLEHPTCFLWIGGSEKSRFLRQMSKEAGSDSHIAVRFLNSRENVFEYIAGSDVFLLPSRHDCFPLVMLEAASYAKPIIAFRGSGGGEEFIQDDAGILVPPLDVQAMAQEIVSLFHNPVLGRALGSRAKQKVSNHCTVDISAPKILKVIQKYQDVPVRRRSVSL